MRYLTAGESHGPKICIIVDGVPSGINLNEKDIDFDLMRRSSGFGRSFRQDTESNSAIIVSGVSDGKTTGNPVCVDILNFFEDNQQDDNIPRPGHADLNGVLKHNFDSCKNVSERASARETAARIVAGVIAKNFLQEFNAEVYSYVSSIGSVSIKEEATNLPEDLPSQADIAMSEVMCPNVKASDKMISQIERAKSNGDTLGGSVKLIGVGLLPGLGGYSQGYDRLDSKIAQSIISVPSVKSISIGSSDYQSSNVGSASIDQIFKDSTSGLLYRKTNYAGGIEGGMTNGMPIVVSAKVKPVPTIKKDVYSVDLETMEGVRAAIKYRSDVCVVPNVAVVCESELALVLANCYLDKFGHDCISDIKFGIDGYKQRIKSFK